MFGFKFYFFNGLNVKYPNQIFKTKNFKFLKIKQPSWFFNKAYYNNSNFVKAYKKYIYNYVHYLNASSVDLESKIDQLFELEKLIGNVINKQQFFLK